MIDMSYTCRKNNLTINLRVGDITDFDGDAIVNPANTLMIMGGGVAGAIKRKGGQEIEDEAKRYAPVPIGKAIITHAGRLKCRYVIHAPTVEYPGSKSSIENVEKATKAVIDVAKSKGDVKSIALPLMGAGVGGLKPEESIESMVKVIEVEKPENMNFFIYVLDNETLMKVLGKLKEIGWICT